MTAWWFGTFWNHGMDYDFPFSLEFHNPNWVWVKIRYPNNWMVNTKLDEHLWSPRSSILTHIQLTPSFFRGVGQPPTRWVPFLDGIRWDPMGSDGIPGQTSACQLETLETGNRKCTYHINDCHIYIYILVYIYMYIMYIYIYIYIIMIVNDFLKKIQQIFRCTRSPSLRGPAITASFWPTCHGHSSCYSHGAMSLLPLGWWKKMGRSLGNIEAS